MRRPIIGFHQDAEEHWVADLACGHAQHVRHDPPWQVRPWVVSPEGRAGYLGTTLDCVVCDEERAGNPWLRIGAEDYEAHMGAVGQSQALRELFADVYSKRRPRRLLVLGCTTGSDFLGIDPDVTELAVGVDVNADYLEVARGRLGALGPRLRLIHDDVLRAPLPARSFDLVHAALLLEYVDPRALFPRLRDWLAPGGACSVITQEPAPGVAAVSATPYRSLQALAGRITLRAAPEIAALASAAGLRLADQRELATAGGKRLVSSVLEGDVG